MRWISGLSASMCLNVSTDDGLASPDVYKEHLDQLGLYGVIISPYVEHCKVCPYVRVSLYSECFASLGLTRPSPDL